MDFWLIHQKNKNNIIKNNVKNEISLNVIGEQEQCNDSASHEEIL
jgi:hypothetical protein|tara:strand:+ start:826 stop:960 length:135 start_codon:yes stop_codon:yes gene_type:complete